jgi:hypothetical protein
MGYSATTVCPQCRAGYVVSCRTEGAPASPSDYPHCFACESCGRQMIAEVPANADVRTIDVRRS